MNTNIDTMPAKIVKPSKQPSSTRNNFRIWFDTALIRQHKQAESILERVCHSKYSGVILYPDNLEKYQKQINGDLQKIISVKDKSELTELINKKFIQPGDESAKHFVISTSNEELLEFHNKLKICYKAFVKDADTLHKAIEVGKKFDYLSILFDDPTNIPLELVIAELQPTNTILMKEIKNTNDVEDAIVSLGVLEVGADGIIFSPDSHETYNSFIKELDDLITNYIKLQVGTITLSEPIGMGYRSCIDLAAMFNSDEGMLVGSTSQGGLLCCPEVFYLPYMELRPFRVNAGGVHSYIFNVNNTDYLSELKAGSSVMVVNAAGKVKKYPVGRIKTEIRPLRLIEAEFEGGKKVNVIMQDDWHVRIYSDKVTPLNITELKPGDTVLGYLTEPGRHVGIKVDEHIIEK